MLAARALLVSANAGKPSKGAIKALLQRNFPDVASVIRKTSPREVRVTVYGCSDSLLRFIDMLRDILPESGVSSVSEVEMTSAEQAGFLGLVILPTSRELSSGPGSSGSPSIAATTAVISPDTSAPSSGATGSESSVRRTVKDMSGSINRKVRA